jgi:hypothetical protein
MQGEQGPDPDRVRALMDENSDEWAAFRPEVLGSVGAAHSDGTLDDGDVFHVRGRRPRG